MFFFVNVCPGAVHGQSSGERASPGPQAEDSDAVGRLPLLRGQDSPHHAGGESRQSGEIIGKSEIYLVRRRFMVLPSGGVFICVLKWGEKKLQFC